LKCHRHEIRDGWGIRDKCGGCGPRMGIIYSYVSCEEYDEFIKLARDERRKNIKEHNEECRRLRPKRTCKYGIL